MKIRLLILMNLMFALALFAQENKDAFKPATSDPGNSDVQLLYRHEQEFGIVLHSSGWGINFRRCKHVTGYKKRVLELEMVGLRHPKELKLRAPDGTRGYFYGKQYMLTALRGGYGFHRTITGKSDRRGVELRLLTEAGPSLGLAKPVYLNVQYPDPVYPAPYVDIYVEKYDPNNPRHTPDYILGRAGYFRGIEEMNFYPGGFFKLGISFEHANLDDEIKMLEAGMIVDVYYKTVPVMAFAHNNQVYLNVYLNIMFGKKWF